MRRKIPFLRTRNFIGCGVFFLHFPFYFDYFLESKSDDQSEDEVCTSDDLKSHIALLERSGLLPMMVTFVLDATSALICVIPSSEKKGTFLHETPLLYPFSRDSKEWEELCKHIPEYVAAEMTGVIRTQEVRKLSKVFATDWYKKCVKSDWLGYGKHDKAKVKVSPKTPPSISPPISGREKLVTSSGQIPFKEGKVVLRSTTPTPLPSTQKKKDGTFVFKLFLIIISTFIYLFILFKGKEYFLYFRSFYAFIAESLLVPITKALSYAVCRSCFDSISDEFIGLLGLKEEYISAIDLYEFQRRRCVEQESMNESENDESNDITEDEDDDDY